MRIRPRTILTVDFIHLDFFLCVWIYNWNRSWSLFCWFGCLKIIKSTHARLDMNFQRFSHMKFRRQTERNVPNFRTELLRIEWLIELQMYRMERIAKYIYRLWALHLKRVWGNCSWHMYRMIHMMSILLMGRCRSSTTNICTCNYT